MSSEEIRELIRSLCEEEIAESNSNTSMQNLDDDIIIHEQLEIAKAYIFKQLQGLLILLETMSNRKVDTHGLFIQG